MKTTKHPLIDKLDLRPPPRDPWDFPRFPRRVAVFIATGRVHSRAEIALESVARQIRAFCSVKVQP